MRQAGVTEAPARDRGPRAYVDFGVDESWEPAPPRRRRAESWIDESELFAAHYDLDPPPTTGAHEELAAMARAAAARARPTASRRASRADVNPQPVFADELEPGAVAPDGWDLPGARDHGREGGGRAAGFDAQGWREEPAAQWLDDGADGSDDDDRGEGFDLEREDVWGGFARRRSRARAPERSPRVGGRSPVRAASGEASRGEASRGERGSGEGARSERGSRERGGSERSEHERGERERERGERGRRERNGRAPRREPRDDSGRRESARRAPSRYADMAARRPGSTLLVEADAVPVSIDVLAHPALEAAPRATAARAAVGGVPGRRTVTIRGRGAERDLAFPAPGRARRAPVRRHERPGFKPDRTALWALLLCVVLVLVAATSSHAAALSHAARSAPAHPAARVAHRATPRAGARTASARFTAPR